MKNLSWLIFVIPTWIAAGCGQQSSSTPPTTASCPAVVEAPLCDGPASSSWTAASSSGSSTVSVSVSGTSVCSSNVNVPCTSVTICVPGSTTQCQTISDILIDTGSYGLRIFSQAIPQNLCNALPILTDTSNRQVAECAQFGSANDWGPVANADLQLGGLATVNTSIQIIHRSFGTASCDCAENGPTDAGINGIIGVGLLTADCGSACQNSPDVGYYFGCNGTNCSGTTVPTSSQVQNPIPLLSAGHNNGVQLTFADISTSGSNGLSGTMTLGINGVPGGVNLYQANTHGRFSTTYNGVPYTQSFIDSGSNVYIFNDSSIGLCGSTAPGFFCPGSTLNLSARMIGSGGVGNNVIGFTIDDTETLLGTHNTVFKNIGAAAPSGFSSSFDWGFPFFVNRSVYVGPVGSTATGSGGVGTWTGPYWAF